MTAHQTTDVFCAACENRATEQSPLDKDALLTSVAMLLHELRNGHNGIQGLVQMLGRDLPADAASSRQAQLLTTLCAQQVKLLDDLLLLARTRKEPLRLHPEAANVHELVEQVCLLHAHAAKAKGLMLSRVIESGVPPGCRVDVQRLRQVLGNLIGNAVQYTGFGSVTLTVRALHDPRDPRVTMCFEVSDTGSGMTDQSLACLGRLFERLDSDATPQKGTGLGIAVARRLVQAMGGTLSFTSKLGEGTRATVHIKVERA